MSYPRLNQNFEQIEEDPYLSRWTDGDEETGDEELENYSSLPKLRLISSKLQKNSAIAQTLLLAKKSNIIGGSMFVQVKAPPSMQTAIEDLLEKEYKGIDVNEEYSLQQMFEQIITGAFIKGDILINLPTDKSRAGLKTYVELIEASRILTPSELVSDPLVRNGVKLQKNGKVEGYWVKNLNSKKALGSQLTLFSDKKENFTFFPAHKGGRRVTYLFKSPTALRPNMSRQFPALTQCLEDIRLLDKYKKAIVIGAQVGACYSGFITTSNPAGAKKAADASDKTGKTGYMKNVGKLQPGTMTYLRRGDSVDFASPSRPADNTEPFIKRMLINCSATVRVAYEIAFMHLEDVNLSSWKGGIIEARRDAALWVNDLGWICEWISKTLILEAITNRSIKGSLKNVSITSHFPRYDPLDDEKAARGANINLNKNKTTSRHIVCGENNINYDKMLQDRENEALDEVRLEGTVLAEKKKLEEKLGIIFPEDSPTQAETDLEGQKTENRDTSDSRRAGEGKGPSLDSEEGRERKQDDGNI